MPTEAFKEIQDELNETHFSKISRQYRLLRTTDLAPVITISEYLRHYRNIKIVDLGCGAGRYDRLLFSVLATNLAHLFCVDKNNSMLQELQTYLSEKGIHQFSIHNASAEKLPFPSNSCDAVVSFNALHHFRLKDTIQEISRVLSDGGWAFLYTRTPLQNMQTIWGRFFPMFNSKETRLFNLGQIEKILLSSDIELQTIHFYTYPRKDTLDRLEYKARQHHYSTFTLYSEKELEKAITMFRKKIQMAFPDTNNIYWTDRNLMIVARKQ